MPFRARVPFIPQMEAVECGAASLAMVLGYYGHHAPLSEVRQACGISRDGSSARAIVLAAGQYGLVPRARRLEPPALADLPGPAILHWEMNHFVVLERWAPNGARLLDPGVGRRTVYAEQFDRSFTGICIDFSPGPAFTTRRRERVSRGRYLQVLKSAPGALAMILAASLALNVLAVGVPLVTRVVLDHVIGRRQADWLTLVGASALGLVTFIAVYSGAREALILRVRRHLDVAITSRFLAHLLSLPIPFFAQRPTADLMMRVQANQTIRDALAGQSVSLLAGGVMLFFTLVLMFTFDVHLSWIVLAASLIYIFIYWAVQSALIAGNDETQRKDVAARHALLQTLKGIATIKSAGVERVSHRRWLNTYIESLNANTRLTLRQQRIANALLAVQLLVPIVVLAVGGRRVVDGSLSTGALVGFQMLQAGFLGPLQSIVETLMNLQRVPVLLNRMDDVLLSEPEPMRERRCPRLRGEIVFENVSFRYAPTSPLVLSDISLRIDAGQKVALVGASGCGKSTLARLLLGLYAPTEGRILLDDHDLATLDLASVRRQFGVVLQETALFEGTIADNLRLFYPNASMEHVAQAARVAQIHHDILAMPRGYDTHISAGGEHLSGGQRQRLALARAIIAHPSVMVLDEATSALDAVTEAAIENYLSTRACTRIVIAHRLSTVRDADAIFVLEDGKIAEHGTHDGLVAAGGHYARLVANSQVKHVTEPPPPQPPSVSGEDLARFGIFSSWSESNRSSLARELERVDFPAGSRIVEQDSRATGLFFLIEGEVAVELSEPGLPAWTVAELEPGGVFGEVGLLDGSPSSAAVVARSPVRGLRLQHARAQEVLQRDDVLGVRLVLALGALVAERIRDAVRRYSDAAPAKPLEPMARAAGSPPPRPRLLELPETLLGAPLSATENAGLVQTAQSVVVEAGDALFSEGTPSDRVFVLLAGRVALRSGELTLRTAEAGAILGETSLFGGEQQPISAIALAPCQALAIDANGLRELLLSGRRSARRLLSPLTESLVRHLRLANLRLREAVALREGEIERAHQARDDALAAAREEREALLTTTSGGVPVVRASPGTSTAAACLTALLRARGRPVTLQSVLEAYAVEHGQGEPLEHVARSFGLRCRSLDIPFEELRFVEGPFLAIVEDQRVVVAERRRFRRWRIMDPLQGEARVVGDATLRERFVGRAFEIREDAFVGVTATFFQRIGSYARAHVIDLVRLLFIALILQGLTTAMSLATALTVARVFPFGDRSLLWTVVETSLILAASYAILQQLQARATEHLKANFDRDLLDQIVDHVLRLPISFFDRFAPGEIIQRFAAFENIRLLVSFHAMTAAVGAVSLVVAVVLLLTFDPRLAVVALGMLAAFALATCALSSTLRRASADEVRARAKEQEQLIEILQGIATLRMSGDPTSAHQRWLMAFNDEVLARLRRDRVLALSIPALDWLSGAALVVSLWWGARDVLAGTLLLGPFVAFLSLLGMFIASARGLTSLVLSSAPMAVDYGLVRATLSEPREQAAGSLVAPGKLGGAIALEQVSFRYRADSPLVLKNVSLEIVRGMKVALVGASGSGKSTLGKLLLGMYLPTSGRILFDGRDITGLDLEALRQQLGVVLQDPFLLTGSVRENLSLGAESATLECIADAAMRAAIHDDIMKMPMNYSTRVAEGGTTFSGGQRQRCVIARALVTSPAILLLDEATSALDNVTQSVVEQHLSRSSATRIVIAHRLSTIVDSDLIVVLRKGEIAEKGTHEELLSAGGVYAELVRAQLL